MGLGMHSKGTALVTGGYQGEVLLSNKTQLLPVPTHLLGLPADASASLSPSSGRGLGAGRRMEEPIAQEGSLLWLSGPQISQGSKPGAQRGRKGCFLS